MATIFKKKFPSLSSLGSDGNTAFLRAARAGNLEKVLEYLKQNIDINTSNANGLNALHLASKDGHVNVVTELLKRGANVDASTKKGNTALHIASLAGQEEVVKILVQNGASVNVQSQNGFTPLYMAAQENHDNVVRYLLANGANQSLATEDGFTPLAVAMQQGHDKVVAVLLENDTRGKVRLPALHIAAKKDDCKAAALLLQNDHNPDVTSKSGFTPLHIAAHYGNESIANLLLQRGADVNYAAKHNITPLHVAAKWGKTNMVALLLEKGANIEAKTRDGLTPLHCAARSGHEQVVDMMLERGAPISSKTKNGLAPLHMASQGDHVDAARILLYHKAPVDEVTVDYLTALHVAAHCGHVRVAKLLLDRKADPNARALNGFTPLHIACKKNRIKVVELLLKHGASIEATTESGLTPLHVASFMGCMNIVIYLIQHGASPDVPTVRGETPLHLAARANQTDIIRILLRNGAQVDARAREQQTPLHIASRLGNVDIVMLLLQHGAAVDATTKDLYTALHIAAKEGQEEVASVLLEHGASLTATTKKGFTPLHLAAKYGNMKVARLLLQRDAPVDAQGKNGVTPLHVASHYDHQNVALLLLDKGASPHATAKNGHTPLHIAARKNQMDIATTLLEYGAKANAESKAGFTPLHLSSQEGHTDMSTLLIEHQADPNQKAKNGLTPLHLCAQEDRVNVAAILVKNGADVDATTKAGYTPLHVACHFGQVNMVRFLLQHGVNVDTVTNMGYTPLHQAAQQGHVLIINLLLENKASPNAVTNQGQTALSIAQKLGYISVVETLKVVTETTITTTTTTIVEEKYKVVAPESMQETFMSDSEDEGGEDTMLGDQPYRYLTVDEMKSLGDDSLPIDVTRDERMDNRDSMADVFSTKAPPTAVEDSISPQHGKEAYLQQLTANYAPDNVDISRHPVSVGFLVSFMVDARGGAMRGCRHSGVRVMVPPRKAPMPMRVTCRYLKKDKLTHPPPLMEGEALASRILELGPAGAKFLGPVIIEVPHFGSLRGKEREIVILRSDNGETWREHTLEATEEAVQEVLNESFDGEDLNQLEDLNTNRITRILTTDFPQYFAIVSRIRQEVHAIGPEGGMVSSTVVPQVQAVFPQGALTKKIKVGLQAQPISAELVSKLLGNRVAVSPIVTVEPRRRKFHKPITLTIPVPQAANKGMINQYSGDAPTLRLLCSITGGTTRAQWEDVTGSTPLTFVNDCVSFTTTVSARFWLMDCRNIGEATKMATELYKEAIHVPFMAKFVVFSKRVDILEARLRVFCMTDDKEDKTLEHQEHFTEVAKSRDVEVLEGKPQYVEFAGNLIPVTKSGDQLQLSFHAFRENRLPFTVRVKDPHADTVGRIIFMREPKVAKGEAPQSPICILNIVLPENITPDTAPSEPDLLSLEKKYSFLRDGGLTRPEMIHRADIRLSDICNLLGSDWVPLANELGVETAYVNVIKTEYPDSIAQQAMVLLRLWMQQAGNKATGNILEKGLRKIGRDDIVNQCIFNVELVTDDVEKAVAKVHLDQSGFDAFKEELGPSRDTSLRRNASLDVSYDEQDMMKESESVEELAVDQDKVVSPKQDEKETKVESPQQIQVKEEKKDKEASKKDEKEEEKKEGKEYEREEKKYVGEEKDIDVLEQFLEDKVKQKTETEPLKATTTVVTVVDAVERTVAEEELIVPATRTLPAPIQTEEEKEAERKRKSEFIHVISEELGRLDDTFKSKSLPGSEKEVQPETPPKEERIPVSEEVIVPTVVTKKDEVAIAEVSSPKTMKTPPPSPAEPREGTGADTSVLEAAQLAESETWHSEDLELSSQPADLSSTQEWTEKAKEPQPEKGKAKKGSKTEIQPETAPPGNINNTSDANDTSLEVSEDRNGVVIQPPSPDEIDGKPIFRKGKRPKKIPEKPKSEKRTVVEAVVEPVVKLAAKLLVPGSKKTAGEDKTDKNNTEKREEHIPEVEKLVTTSTETADNSKPLEVEVAKKNQEKEIEISPLQKTQKGEKGDEKPKKIIPEQTQVTTGGNLWLSETESKNIDKSLVESSEPKVSTSEYEEQKRKEDIISGDPVSNLPTSTSQAPDGVSVGVKETASKGKAKEKDLTINVQKDTKATSAPVSKTETSHSQIVESSHEDAKKLLEEKQKQELQQKPNTESAKAVNKTEPSGTPEVECPVKAEINLVVKTSEPGEESIEIGSISESVASEYSDIPSEYSDIPKAIRKSVTPTRRLMAPSPTPPVQQAPPGEATNLWYMQPVVPEPPPCQGEYWGFYSDDYPELDTPQGDWTEKEKDSDTEKEKLKKESRPETEKDWTEKDKDSETEKERTRKESQTESQTGVKDDSGRVAEDKITNAEIKKDAEMLQSSLPPQKQESSQQQDLKQQTEEKQKQEPQKNEVQEHIKQQKSKPEETKKEEESSEIVEEGCPVKAEIKLLVKTSDSGKEAIEIRSIREFVDPQTEASDAEAVNSEITQITGECPASESSEPPKASRKSMTPTRRLMASSPTPPPQPAPPGEATNLWYMPPVVPEPPPCPGEYWGFYSDDYPELVTPLRGLGRSMDDWDVKDTSKLGSKEENEMLPKSEEKRIVQSDELHTIPSSLQHQLSAGTATPDSLMMSPDSCLLEHIQFDNQSLSATLQGMGSPTSPSGDAACVEELSFADMFSKHLPKNDQDPSDAKTEDDVPDFEDELLSPSKESISESAHTKNLIEDETQDKSHHKKDSCFDSTVPETITQKPQVPVVKRIIEDAETSQSTCYVTTPTMQRRKFSNQNLHFDHRPLPLDVSDLHSGDDITFGEAYIVTEPGEGHVQSLTKVSSSPDILGHSVPLLPMSSVEKQKATTRVQPDEDAATAKTDDSELSSTRKATFRIGSYEDGDQQEAPVEDLPEDGTEILEKMVKDAKRQKKVERKFERMASQTMEEEQESEDTREVVFERMMSQISTEEFDGTESDFQKVYSKMIEDDISEDWDSHDPDTPERELDVELPAEDNALQGETDSGATTDGGNTFGAPLRGAEFTGDVDLLEQLSSEFDPDSTATQTRVVTRVRTTTRIGDDGQPVTVTTTETVTSEGEPDELRQSMQTVLDQFMTEEKTKESPTQK